MSTSPPAFGRFTRCKALCSCVQATKGKLDYLIWLKVCTSVSFTGWSVLLAGPESGIGRRSAPWLVLLEGAVTKAFPRFGVIFFGVFKA